MTKYFCVTCKKSLKNEKHRSIILHNNGAKHSLLKRAYYAEIFDYKRAKAEIDSILRSTLVTENNDIQKTITKKNYQDPPIKFEKTFKIPEAAKQFKLPKNFNFLDKKKFPKNINEAIKKYITND